MRQITRRVPVFLLFALLLLVGFSLLPLAGETPAPSAPEETDILLPTLVIEVEDFAAEQILAELPPIGELQVPRVTADVFEGAGPFTADAALAMPMPREDFDIGTGRMVGESSIYSTGRIGAGSMNHIIGAVSLYKLGADPRFRFEFSHEGLDGYSLKAPGSGYFHSENSIDGWLAGGIGPTEVQFEGSFLEREEGLQDNSEFYSSSHRYFKGGLDLSGQPAPGFLVAAGIDAEYSTRIYTDADDPPGAEETIVTPFFRAAWELDRLALNFNIDSEFQLMDDDTWSREYYRNTLTSSIGAEYALRAPLVLGARAGVSWWVDNEFFFPFGLSLETAVGRFALRAEGGLELGSPRFAELWRTTPLISITDRDVPPPEQTWFGSLEFQYQLIPGILEINPGARYEYRVDTIDTPAFESSTASYPVELRERQTLRPGLAAVLTPGENTELSVRYEAAFLELLSSEPRHKIEVDADIRHASRRFGGGMSALWSYRSGIQLPDIGLRSFFRISDGVELEARLQDLLEPALSDGRAAQGDTITEELPFIQPGFRFLITAQIFL
ncbi:MAG: hypothetical protein LC641_03445 [Spirochaeta sp.]|nr:hypothetical protein [Spirochaeta sp.]